MSLLKKLREEHGLSQEELGNKVGLTRSAIAMIENGTNKLTVDNAKKLGSIFNVEWKDFFVD